jgi:hypothetical protein
MLIQRKFRQEEKISPPCEYCAFMRATAFMSRMSICFTCVKINVCLFGCLFVCSLVRISTGWTNLAGTRTWKITVDSRRVDSAARNAAHSHLIFSGSQTRKCRSFAKQLLKLLANFHTVSDSASNRAEPSQTSRLQRTPRSAQSDEMRAATPENHRNRSDFSLGNEVYSWKF